VPIYDRPGYIQLQPPAPAPPAPPAAPIPVLPPLLNENQLKLLFDRVGPISGSIDCVVRVGGTLEAHMSSITSDFAPDDANGVGFGIAAVGSLKLPRAAQWSAVRIDPTTVEATPVDPRHGVPIVRSGVKPYELRDASDVRRTNPRVQYGLLMANETSRALFPQPKIDPAKPGRLTFDPPLLADPYSLVQSNGSFPRASYALRLKEAPTFNISADNQWRIANPNFSVPAKPVADLASGGEWKLNRDYPNLNPIVLNINSAAAEAWKIAVPPCDLHLELPGFPAALQQIFTIHTTYEAVSGGVPRLGKPDLVFAGALKELTDTLDSLSKLTGLPFNFDVTVTAGGGASPSFIVRLQLVFRIGEGPNERVDIGVGKFYGQFLIRGELEAALTGVQRALLFLEFQGDIQQGILPPLLYAGGLFRFSIEIHETGRPVIQLALGVVASIGGDLIKGLIEVEVTVHYGYTLIPETLEPGVLLGLEARAKLLGGLVGFSFSVEAMARIKRADPHKITVWAQIRVAATVQVAIFIEDEVDFETQFEQDIPLALAVLIPGVGLLPAATLL